MEASGRPSGTGRPSLPPPRADNERADELRAPRRKPRLHESASVAPDASDAPPPEPFEKVLDHAEGAPVAPEQAAADSIQSAPAPAASPARASAVKPKKVAAEEPELAVEPSADADAALLPLVAGAPPAHAEPPHAGRVRPDALPLPASNSLTPVGPTLEAKPDATQAAATPGDALPAAAVDTASLPATERAEAPQALAPEARIDAARSIEAKPASAPPAPPAENARASEILRQLRVQLTPELRSATIQLSPPELGRISIRLRVERGELSAVVRAEKRETLDALARHVPELEATLGQLGIRARAIDLQLGFEQQGTRQGAHEPPHSQGSPGHEHDPRAREHERRLFASLSARAGGIDTYA